MGVKNWGEDVVPWKWTAADLIVPGTFAIDVPNYLARKTSAFLLRREKSGRIPLSHVSFFIGLVKATLNVHILPVFIFDGPPESRKRPSNPEIVNRASQYYKSFQLNRDPYDEEMAIELWRSPALRAYFAAEHLKDLGRLFGIPTVTAPSEAEMLAAALCRDGTASTVVSNDVDALLFGSPHVTKQLLLSSNRILCVSRTDLETHLGLDLEMIRDLAIVSGCDFHREGVKGVGVRRGAVLLKKYGGLMGLLKSKGYSSSEQREFIEAREVLDEASFLSTGNLHLKLNPPLPSKSTWALEAVMPAEKSIVVTNEIVSLWRRFGNRQSTLEQWL
jgi:flap endonuclease-1